MRNLVEYPMTLSEICDCLERLADEIGKEGRMGDMRPLLLKEASRIVMRAGFAVSGVTRDKQPMPKRRQSFARA